MVMPLTGSIPIKPCHKQVVGVHNLLLRMTVSITLVTTFNNSVTLDTSTDGTWVCFWHELKKQEVVGQKYNRTTQAHYQQRRIRTSLLSQAMPTHVTSHAAIQSQ